MIYACSVCGDKVDGDVVIFQAHTDKHIIDLVKHDHPDWVEKDGVCKKCFDYYKAEIDGSPFKTAGCAQRQRFYKKVFNGFKKIFWK